MSESGDRYTPCAHARAPTYTCSSSADIPIHQQVTPQVCRFTHFISACSRNGGGGGRVGRSKLRQIGITTWPLGQVCFPLIHRRRPECQAASLRLKILNICRGGLENRPCSVSAAGFAMPVVLNAKLIIISAEGICCQPERRQRINSIKYCILRILLQFPSNCYRGKKRGSKQESCFFDAHRDLPSRACVRAARFIRDNLTFIVRVIFFTATVLESEE